MVPKVSVWFISTLIYSNISYVNQFELKAVLAKTLSFITELKACATNGTVREIAKCMHFKNRRYNEIMFLSIRTNLSIIEASEKEWGIVPLFLWASLIAQNLPAL